MGAEDDRAAAGAVAALAGAEDEEEAGAAAAVGAEAGTVIAGIAAVGAEETAAGSCVLQLRILNRKPGSLLRRAPRFFYFVCAPLLERTYK